MSCMVLYNTILKVPITVTEWQQKNIECSIESYDPNRENIMVTPMLNETPVHLPT